MAQTSITFTTDQSLFDLFTTAACVQYGYQASIPDPNNPGEMMTNTQTPAQFAQQVIINFASDVTAAFQAQQAADAARQSALANVQNQISSFPITVTAS